MSGEAGANEHDRVERAYGEYAGSARKRRSWAADNPGNIAIRRELVAAAFGLAGDALRSADVILDAGCGTGWWLERLHDAAEVHASLEGIDLLPDRVTAARERVPHAAIEVGDVKRLPFEDGRFDVVTMFTVLSSLSHAADLRRALWEARRVLAAGGLLLIWEPRVPNPLNRHTLLVRRREVADALPGSAIETVPTTLFPPLARRLGGRTEQLYPALARVPGLRSHHVICARPATPPPS